MELKRKVLQFDNNFQHNIWDIAKAMAAILAIPRSSEDYEEVVNQTSKPYNIVEVTEYM
jgi:hypothetical protein